MEESSVLTCELCAEVYDLTEREPVTLTCGHTFCRLCLFRVEKTSRPLSCPACRTEHNGEAVVKLQPTYILLNMLETDAFPRKDNLGCDIHFQQLGYYCEKCSCLVCGLCISESHHRDKEHNIIPVKKMMQDRKTKLKENIEQLSKTLNQETNEIMSDSLQTVLRNLELLQRCNEAQCCIRSLTTEIGKEMAIDTLLSLEQEYQELSSTVSEHRYRGSSPEAKPKDTPLSAFFHDFWEMKKEKLPLQCYVQVGNDRWGQLTWKSGNMLNMYSLTPSIPRGFATISLRALLSLDVGACYAFLELATPTKQLGQVTIRLWHKLRRAQHFMGLCMGLWGPSYKESVFHRIQETPYSKFIVGGSYMTDDGCSSTVGLMENLEWDGPYVGSDKEWQVVCFGGGKPHMDAVFGVCINLKVQGGRSRCPFGEVVEGQEVMKEAAERLCSGKISIVNCGLTVTTVPA